MAKTDNKLLSVLRRAISDYSMIKSGDKVAVGLSGGKDSLALLALIARYKIFSPESFDLMAVTIDMGFEGADFSHLRAFCDDLGVDYVVEKTDAAEIIFEKRKETSPCSLCSKMRRGALNTVLIRHGYNKLALGHHGDDLVETFFLSLFYEGRLSVFSPVSYMDRTGITVIRPLIYAEEKNIIAFSRNFPIFHNPCPVNHKTRREYMKDLIKFLQTDMPASRDNIFRAITNPERNNLWSPLQNDKK